MKRIAEVLGVSRSNLLDRRGGRTRPRGPYRKAGDEGLLPIIRRFVDERPTYGYRRIAALVNRELADKGRPIVNRKRVHRIVVPPVSPDPRLLGLGSDELPWGAHPER